MPTLEQLNRSRYVQRWIWIDMYWNSLKLETENNFPLTWKLVKISLEETFEHLNIDNKQQNIDNKQQK